MIGEIVLFLVIGGTIGFLGGLFGLGGAAISIPVLGIFFGMSEQVAQGTSIVMVLSNVVLGLWRYNRHQHMDKRMATILAISAIPFSYLAARVATSIGQSTLRIAFICFVLAIVAYLIWRLVGAPPAKRHPLPLPFVIVVGGISGAMAGAFGIGGAMFAIPAMSALFGLSQVQAQGMALALAVPGALVALVVYGFTSNVDWGVGLMLAVGGLLTVQSGAHLAHRLPDRALRWLFVGFLLAAAAGLVARTTHQ